MAKVKDTFDRSKMPEVGPAPKFTPPGVVRRKLSNGLEVLVAERHELPVLSLELVVKGGETLVPADKHGLAGLTASLLSGGTTSRRDAPAAGRQAPAEISAATLHASGGREAVRTVGLTTLTKHTDRALDLFTDVVLHPTFPAKELERLRNQRLAAIQARSDSAPGIATTVFPPRPLRARATSTAGPARGSLGERSRRSPATTSSAFGTSGITPPTTRR